MPVAVIDRTIQTAKRFSEILSVMVRYGFEDVLVETGLDRWRNKKGELADDAASRLPRSERARMALEELGPTFIKFGQILSTRPDLIPPDWAEEFKRLQSSCPTLPFEGIQARLDDAFPDGTPAMFASIDATPLAAASMAQVHRAVLQDGSRVVVKVLRPGIEKTILGDMQVLTALAEFVERHFAELGYSPTKVVREFERELAREIDFTHEGRAADRFRTLFRDDERIVFPRIHWDATTSEVLTMEEIDGILLSRLGADELSAEDRHALVAAGLDAVFRQCLEFGYFHADPHPGNLMALPGGRIAFLDCGMTGNIDQRSTEQLADLVIGVVSADLDRVIQTSIELAGVDPIIASDRAFRADVWEFVSRFQNASFETLDLGRLLQDFFEVLRRYKLQCPSDLVFLIKAISTIEGVGEQIDPSFDIVGHIKPHLERLVARRYGFRAIRDRVEQGFRRYAELAEDLPQEIQGLLGQLRNNRFSVNLEHRRLDRLTETIEHASRNIAYALIVAAMLVGSAILVLAGQRTDVAGGILWKLGLLGFVASVLLVGARGLSNFRYLTKRKREVKKARRG